MMHTLDPASGEPIREMLGHSIRGEFEELGALIQSGSNEGYRQVLGSCLGVAAYIAVDVCERWPTDADVREIARIVAERETELELEQEEVYDYLSGAALGFKPLTEVLGSEPVAFILPLIVTGSMLFTYRPKGMKWWDYLDLIWMSYEKADTLNVSVVLPAVQVRAKVLKAAAEREAAEESAPETEQE
jgi:hypothetical protein